MTEKMRQLHLLLKFGHGLCRNYTTSTAPENEFNGINAAVAHFALMDKRRLLPELSGEIALGEVGADAPTAQQSAKLTVGG